MEARPLNYIITWLAPRAGKIKSCAVIGYCSRLPVARPLGTESLIPTTMQSFLRFSRCFGGDAHLKDR